MSDELLNEDGVSRRSMLKKSALVGGTMVWAAPVVSSFTSPAFGQDNGTPELVGDKGLSYIALEYSCGADGVRYIKFNLSEDPNNPVQLCETGNSFQTPDCGGFPAPADRTSTVDNSEDCDLFTITFEQTDESGAGTVVRVTAPEPCIIDGVGFAKCGNVGNGGECVSPSSLSGTEAVFADCGV